MDLERVTETLLAAEDDLDLFERTIGGLHYWERVRFWVHRQIRKRAGLIGEPHPNADRSRVTALWRILKSAVVHSPFLAPENDILVYGHERRKQLDGVDWWDVYCDPVMEALEADCTYLEKPYRGDHLTPARTEDVRYLDFVTQGHLLPLQAVSIDLLSPSDVADIERIADRFEADTGVRLDLADRINMVLFRRRFRLPLYERILDRVDPALVVTVVSYGRETFIEACKRRGVPVVELQHGVVSPYHMGYAFPGDRTKRAFPDYFLTFGDFWAEQAAFPIPDDRIIPVGYPHLERRVAELSEAKGSESDRVVFVSQGTTGKDLSQVAVEFADHVPEREVVYKLHPGEYDRWREAYPWLRDADLAVIDSPDPGLYRLFAESTVQVGVYSTALYEGLAFGLDTYVVDLQGAAYMDRLIEMGGAILVRTVEDLVTELRGGSGTSVDTDQFFRPNALGHIGETIAAIRANHESPDGETTKSLHRQRYR